LKPGSILLLLLFISGPNRVLPGGDDPPSAPASRILGRSGKGVLEAVGEQRLLHLEGSWHEMGRQHGALLKEEVHAGVQAFLRYSGRRGRDRATLVNTFHRMKPHIPARYLQEMEGLAEGAGIEVEAVQAAHMIPTHFHCSGAAAWGRATLEGKLYHTRSLDYAIDIGGRKAVQESALVIVSKPPEGHAHAAVSWAGFIGCVSGMNAAGISVGEMGCRSRDESLDGMPMVFLLREVLHESSTLADGIGIFEKGPRTCGFNFILADGNQPAAVALEVNRSRVVVFHPEDDDHPPHFPLIDTVRRVNHFVDPGMARSQRGVYDPRKSKLGSWLFYQGMSAYFRKHFGRIDDRVMVGQLRLYPPTCPCLHQAVFCPTDRTFWVSHAVSPWRSRLAGAQNRPFYRYDLKALLRGDPADRHLEILRHPVRPPVLSRPEQKAVHARTDLPEVPSLFRFEETGFPCKLSARGRYAGVERLDLEFPSPCPENGQVHAVYHRPKGPGPFPAAVVLHGLLTDFIPAGFLAERLALQGVASLMVYLPGYGPRNSGRKSTAWMGSPEAMTRFFTRGIQDIRRAATWLQSRAELDPDRLCITGISLGGLMSALAMGVEPRFSRGVFLLSGGDLAGIFFHAQETRWAAKRAAGPGISPRELADRMKPFDPLTHAGNLRGRNVLFLNAAFDTVVSPGATRTLHEAAGRPPIRWVPAGHYTAALWLPWAATQAADLFLSDSVHHLLGAAREYARGTPITYPETGQKSSERTRILDCVGFLQAVLKRTVEVKALAAGARNKLLRGTAIPLESGDDLEDLVEQGAPVIRGIARALPAAGLGRALKPGERILPGDALQYWKKEPTGAWRGHAALICRVITQTPNRIQLRIFGSHRSAGCVQEVTCTLRPDRDRIYICRPGG